MAGLTPEEIAVIEKLIEDALAGSTSGPTSGSTSGSAKVNTKLTTTSARDLLKSVKDVVGYGALSEEDVNAFLEYFTKEQKKRITEVATSVYSKRTPGAKPEDLVREVESTMRTEYPQFFEPKKAATDWLWGKIEFGKEGLSVKNQAILANVKSVVDGFQLLSYSDADMYKAAKEIAMGKYTLADFTTQMQQIAIKDYPQFADRFKATPGLTIKDIYKPIRKMLADTWEVDEDSIKNTDPILMQWGNPQTADGKGTQMSYYDAYLKALNDPRRELTKAANEDARSSATAFGRAIGFGV